MNTNPAITAHARDAGRNVVHTVKMFDTVVGTRRSAHRYAYAICRWATVDGERRPIVVRWSRSAKSSGNDFAVAVHDA